MDDQAADHQHIIDASLNFQQLRLDSEPHDALDPDIEPLHAAILRQVEFYFSDGNLVTDKFLIRQINASEDGFVPLSIIASFNKIKKLSEDLAVIATALRMSSVLEVAPDGSSVRRVASLANVNLDEIRAKIVIADKLPWEKPKLEDVKQLFGTVGSVVMARLFKDSDSKEALLPGKLKRQLKNAPTNCMYALVEYASAEEAQAAVARLDDESNWRSGLRVRPLVPLPKNKGVKGEKIRGKSTQPTSSRAHVSTETNPSSAEDVTTQTTTANEVAAWTSAARSNPKGASGWARTKKKTKEEYAAWASGARSHIGVGGSTASAPKEEDDIERVLGGAISPANKQACMPNHGAGFGMGRGVPPPGAIPWTAHMSVPGN